MAELFGKRDGCCGGRGGTMHLYDRAVGLFGTNGIVAAGIGHAVGAGISARVRGTDDVGVAFFGDGAVNHGGFHESVNFAGVQRRRRGLRLREQPLRHGDAARRCDPQPRDRQQGGGLRHSRRRGRRQRRARRPTRPRRTPSTAHARGDGPTLIEAKTYRTVGHHEGDPVVGTYRTQDEIDAWAEARSRSRCSADG